MMRGLLWMVVLPSVAGMLLNQFSRGKISTVCGPPLAPFVKVGLFTVVSINGASIARYLKHPDGKLALIIAVTFVTVALGYVIGAVVSSRLHYDYANTVAVQFNSGMRNLSAGAVLAVQYFPLGGGPTRDLRYAVPADSGGMLRYVPPQQSQTPGAGPVSGSSVICGLCCGRPSAPAVVSHFIREVCEPAVPDSTAVCGC